MLISLLMRLRTWDFSSKFNFSSNWMGSGTRHDPEAIKAPPIFQYIIVLYGTNAR